MSNVDQIVSIYIFTNTNLSKTVVSQKNYVFIFLQYILTKNISNKEKIYIFATI